MKMMTILGTAFGSYIIAFAMNLSKLAYAFYFTFDV